jgi:hypothetical protein
LLLHVYRLHELIKRDCICPLSFFTGEVLVIGVFGNLDFGKNVSFFFDQHSKRKNFFEVSPCKVLTDDKLVKDVSTWAAQLRFLF